MRPLRPLPAPVEADDDVAAGSRRAERLTYARRAQTRASLPDDAGMALNLSVGAAIFPTPA